MVVSSVPGMPRAAPEVDSRVGVAAALPARGPRWLIAACLAVLCVPLLVALAAFRRHPWTPVLDLAMTELRVRDVGGRHTPLIGLPGRIGTLSEQGSHPGPLSFYALAPTYRMLGSTAWALQLATVVIHAVAMGTALVIARRRGGTGLVLAVAVLLAALTAGYGGGTLTEPWNPYLPLLWWVVVLLAVWSVLCGDLPMLPVVVLAASFSAQTHVPYLGLSVGLGAVAVAGAVMIAIRARTERGRVARWLVGAVGIGVLLWLPPTVDALRHEPGNYQLLVEHFSDPPERMVGLGTGVELGLRYFDVAHLLQGDITDPGWLVTSADGHLPSSARGLVLLALWTVAIVVAWRGRHRALVRLHAVVGAGVILMVLAISRIFGVVWYYLLLWGWGIGLLALLASAWTLVHALGERWGDPRRSAAARSAAVVLTVVGLLCVGRFSVAAWDATHADATVATELAAVIDAAAAGLDAEVGVATGHQGRYLITWSDAFHIGSQGYGLISELERRGFDVGAEAGRRVPVTAHRVLEPGGASARVHLATGAFVERWRAVPGAVELASIDPRSSAERAEQSRLRTAVIATLRASGLDDLVRAVDENLFGAAIDERVPANVQIQMGRMLEIGAPLAIFVVPTDTVDP